jgi:hypothetical protein
VRPVRRADNLTAIYEAIAQTMLQPTDCYADSFTFLLYSKPEQECLQNIAFR